MDLRGQPVPNPYIHVSVSDLYIPRIADRYMNVGTVGRTVSFLQIHELQSDCYIGLSSALHLQCTASRGGMHSPKV